LAELTYDESHWKPHHNPWAVAITVTLATFMEVLDTSIANVALQHMAGTLGASQEEATWVLTSYLVSSAIVLPISGWLSNRIGRKRFYMSCVAMFTVCSLLCGIAQTLPLLIVARVLQGAAAAMMVPVGRLVLLRTTPKSELVGALSVLTMPALVGPVVGPILGGFIVTYFDWRWIFFINLPVALVGVVLVRAFVPDVREDHVPPIDWWGVILTGLCLASLLFGFENLGRDFLPPGEIAGLFTISAICFALYWLHARRNPHAIIDLAIFRLPSFRAATVGGAFIRIGVGALPFLLAMLLQVGFGMSALGAGLMTFVSSAGALFMKGAAPPLLRRFGFRQVLIVNAVLSSVSLISYALFTPRSPHWLIMVVLGVGGFFRSLQFTALNSLAYAEIESPQMSRASTTSSMGQQLSQTLGVGLAAMLLHVIQQERGELRLTAAAVSPVFVMLGVISLVSLFWFVRLPHGAGDEMNGRA